jgi:hypothetical protein
MTRKVIVALYPRNKYPSSVSGRTLFPKDREKLKTALGSADEVWVHTRVYARDPNVFLDFDFTHGSLGDENPSEGLRQFSLARSGAFPALPYDTTNMPTLPDDGAFYVNPKMGLVDVQAKAYNASGSIEFEAWATLIYHD